MSDIWEDAKGVLSAVAPTLASMVGGPLAGTATTAILGALGLEPTASTAAAVAALQTATPEQLAALKKIDADMAVAMAGLQLDAEKLQYDNQKDARARESAVKDSTPRVLAYMLTALFAGLTATLVSGYARGSETLVGTIFGLVAGEYKTVLGYYFGGSLSSDSKDDALANSVPASSVRTTAAP